jgi:hypothetical protein
MFPATITVFFLPPSESEWCWIEFMFIRLVLKNIADPRKGVYYFGGGQI